MMFRTFPVHGVTIPATGGQTELGAYATRGRPRAP